MSKEEHVILTAPARVVAGLDDDYVNTLVEVQNECVSTSVNSVARKQYERSNQNDSVIYDLPHPVRKRWAGYLPLHMEIMVQEEFVVSKIMEWLSFPEIEISNLVKNIISASPSFKEMMKDISKDESGTNYGALDPIMFPHAFYAKGSHIWKVEKSFDTASIPEEAPIGFMQPPYSNMFIEVDSDLTINNKVSGDHKLDGFYINQYTIPSSRVQSEWDESFNKVESGTMNGFMTDRGYLTKDGGDIRVIEILAMGRPKDSVVDDATFNFSLIIQDETKSIKEVLEHHNEYYGSYQTRKENVKHFEGINVQNAGEREFESIRKITYLLAELILITTDESTKKEFKPDYTNMMRRVRTHVSKAIRRQSLRKADLLYDHTLVLK